MVQRSLLIALITCLVNALAKFLWSKFQAPEGALSFVPTDMVYIHGLHTWSSCVEERLTPEWEG